MGGGYAEKKGRDFRTKKNVYHGYCVKNDRVTAQTLGDITKKFESDEEVSSCPGIQRFWASKNRKKKDTRRKK